MSFAMSRLAKTWSSTLSLRSRYYGLVSTPTPNAVPRRHFAVKPVIIRKRGDTNATNRTFSPQDIDLGPADYTLDDAGLSKYIATETQQATKSSSPFSSQEYDETAAEVDRILKESGIDIDNFHFNTGPAAPVEPEPEIEDDDDYVSDFEYEGLEKYGKPQFNFPEGSFLGVVAMMLEAAPNGVDMFPNHMRKKLLEKVASNVKNALKRYPHLTEQALFNIVQHTFLSDGPDLAHTHDQAINILFPFAPQKGDIVELPGTPGKCVVSSREYVDNRDNTELPLDERVRMMVLQYNCLDPSLRGRTMRAVHQFDMDVYRLMMAGDTEGMEDLMHERGLIDKNSGRILIDQFEARALEEGYEQTVPKLKGPGAGMARLTALANMPNRHGFDGAQHHIAGGRVRPGAVGSGRSDAVAVRRNAFGEVMPVDEVETAEEAVQRGLKVKEYQRPHVISGESARRLHKQLLYEQQTGGPAEGGAQQPQASMQANVAQLRAAENKRMQQVQAQAQSQAQTQTKTATAPSVRVGSSTSTVRAFDASTHMQAPVHGHAVTLGELRRQAMEDERSAVSEMSSAAQPSAYTKRRTEVDASAAAKLEEMAKRASEPGLSPEEMEARREAVLKEAIELDMKQEEEMRGLSNAERQERLWKAVEERERRLAEKDKERLAMLDVEGQINYERLAPDVKHRYRNCIMARGAGAGKPDPMFIKEGEDLLHVYPDANVQLMDAISGQWDAMMDMRTEEGDETPDNPDEMRFRLMATIASAGKHAFTLEYMQEIFERFTHMRDQPKNGESAHPVPSGPHVRVASDNEHNNVFVGSIKSGTEGPRDDQDIPLPRPLTKKEKTQALMQKAEAVFGQKAVPLEEAETIDPAFREEVRTYYQLRDKRKATRKKGPKGLNK